MSVGRGVTVLMTVVWLCNSVPTLAASGATGSPFGAKPPAYQHYPAKPAVPTPPAPKTTKPVENRGKCSNPYDRSVPLQGDTHKGYTGGGRDPYKR